MMNLQVTIKINGYRFIRITMKNKKPEQHAIADAKPDYYYQFLEKNGCLSLLCFVVLHTSDDYCGNSQSPTGGNGIHRYGLCTGMTFLFVHAKDEFMELGYVVLCFDLQHTSILRKQMKFFLGYLGQTCTRSSIYCEWPFKNQVIKIHEHHQTSF